MSGELTGPHIFSHAEEATFGKDAIDGNNHVNNAYYMRLCQAARVNALAESGKVKSLEERFGSLLLVSFEGRFMRQGFLGDNVSIVTQVEDSDRGIRFSQSILRSNPESMEQKSEIFRLGYLIESGNQKTLSVSSQDGLYSHQGKAVFDAHSNHGMSDFELFRELERQRVGYLEELGMQGEELMSKFRLLIVIGDLKGKMFSPVSPAAHDIRTTVTTNLSHLSCNQRISLGETAVANFECRLPLITREGKIVRIPKEISDAIAQKNLSS